MSKKLFNIEEYRVGSKYIRVDLEGGKVVNVDRDEFEIWLNYTDRLAYTFETGGNEYTKTATMPEYFERFDVCQDLYEFILLYHMDGDPFDIKAPMTEILNDYNQNQ